MSTDDQNLALQLDALQAEGVRAGVSGYGFRGEAGSEGIGGGARRLRLRRCADGLEARPAGPVELDLVGLVEALRAVLTGAGASIDTTKPEGRLFFAMFAALAEFERELIRERTRAGMKAAKRRGRHVGRPRKLGPDELEIAAQLIAQDRSQRVIASTLGVAVSTLREEMKRRAA